MSMPYMSVFDGPNIITTKDLCEILNLDTSRPGLKFSVREIQKAYRQRALRFHPDQRKTHTPVIPVETCNTLMNDVVLARDYMLRGEDNILGKAFVDDSLKKFPTKPDDWFDSLIQIFKGVKAGSSALATWLPWVSRIHNDFSLILLASTFSNNQLNFRYVNVYAKQLDAMRPYLKGIDGSTVAKLLHILKDALQSEQVDIENIKTKLLPILPEELTENPKFDELLAAITGAKAQLTEMLTDKFIAHVKHLVQFWPNFITNVPTWKHIVGVYFTSLSLTSSSLPRYINASKTVGEVILEHKGAVALALTAVPMFIMTAALLPINVAINFGIQFAWIALRASWQILTNSIKLLSSTVNLARSLFNDDVSFAHSAFGIFVSTLNLSVRLAFNIAIELLDSIIFILSNQSLLSSFQNTVNGWLDALIDSVRPAAQQVKKPLELATTDDQIKAPEIVVPEEPGQNLGFFADAPLHNAEDTWLKQLLTNIPVSEENDAAHAGVFSPTA